MSLDISFESAASAVAYLEDAIPRFLRTGSVRFTRDTSALRRRINRRRREALQPCGPSAALAKYIRRELKAGGALSTACRTWGCSINTGTQALAIYPEDVKILALPEVSVWTIGLDFNSVVA